MLRGLSLLPASDRAKVLSWWSREIATTAAAAVNDSATRMAERKEHLLLTANNARTAETQATVCRLQQLSPTVRGVTLSVQPANISAGFKAGQWLDLFIPGLEKVGGFSMVNHPDRYLKEGVVELAVKYSTWPPAHWIHTQCKEGDPVSFRFGGDFFYPSKNQTSSEHSLLLLAGGVGINPLLSMWLQARSMVKESDLQGSPTPPRQVRLLYAASSPDEFIFRNYLECTVSEFPMFSAEYFCSAAAGTAGVKAARIGASEVQESVDKLRPGQVLAYMCGPPDMIRDMEIYLKECQIPADDIRYELWY